MKDADIAKLLEKQLGLLSKQSETARRNEIIGLSKAMCQVVGAWQNLLNGGASYPGVVQMSVQDLADLYRGRDGRLDGTRLYSQQG